MGLNSSGSTGNVNYLSISDGKIAKRVKTEEPNTVKCTSKDGSKVWWEYRYDSVSGKITNVKRHDSTMGYGSKLQIEIEDGFEKFVLEMPWSSRYSSGFFLCMPNIDTTKEIEFRPWMKVIDGTKKTMLYLKESNSKDNIQHFWTKDNPGDLPQMQKIRVKGTDVWDDTDRQDYFENYLNNTFIPAIGKTNTQRAEEFVKKLDAAAAKNDDDDLPF